MAFLDPLQTQTEKGIFFRYLHLTRFAKGKYKTNDKCNHSRYAINETVSSLLVRCYQQRHFIALYGKGKQSE